MPRGVTHAVIDPSVNTVRREAFDHREQLVSVIFHDGVEIVEYEAFYGCKSLRGRIKLLGVREIGDRAFRGCPALSGVEFGDRLETIGCNAFNGCSLRSIKLPSVEILQAWAFSHCKHLTDVEFGRDLERMGFNSFLNCPNLQRIAIPLKDNLLLFHPREQQYNQFEGCENLTTVDIVGVEEIKKTISSLLLEAWRDEMNEEIGRINRELPTIRGTDKANAVQLWIGSVNNRLDHYKAEHDRLLKEHMTLLELAVWKAKLDEKEDNSTKKVEAKRTKIDEEGARREKRITSGADIIIKNILPFLKLE